jgi:TrmH family RNA methyltransferase
VRTAAAAGACAVIACAGGADPFHPRAVRATAGAVYRLAPTVGGRPADVLRDLARIGFTTIGAATDGGVTYDRLDWTMPVALVLGSEGGGLPDDVVERLDGSVSIPMERGIESLSVGAAAAVLLFESARARRGRSAVSDG